MGCFVMTILLLRFIYKKTRFKLLFYILAKRTFRQPNLVIHAMFKEAMLV